MKMNKKRFDVLTGMLAGVLAGVLAGATAQAATLVLEIDAQTAGVAQGTGVQSLVAKGSANCTFVPVNPGQGMAYLSSYYGAKAFVFDGTANSAMVGCTPPSEICGGNAWSWQIWVCNPSLDDDIESVFGWTKREDWPEGRAGESCMEFRYGRSAWNAVEFYGGGNMQWGENNIPMPGQWHHVACVYDGAGRASLYVNGSLREQRWTWLRLRDDAAFYMGAVQQVGGQPEWAWPFSGGIGKLSIYAGAISVGKIVSDYIAERGTYGQNAGPELAVWSGAAGQVLPWSDSVNWLGGVVGGVGSDRVFIENGGIAELTDEVDPLRLLSVPDGGLVLDTGASLTLLNDTVLGELPGNAFSLSLLGGSLVADNLFRTGYNGASSTIVVGGGPNPAELWVKRGEFGRGHDNDSLWSQNGTASMIISNNGVVTVLEGWAMVGRYMNGSSSLTIEDGGRFNYLGNEGLSIGSAGANGVLTMNGGLLDIQPPGRIMMSEWGYGTAVAHLNGGTVSVRQFYDGDAASSKIYFNGTLLTSPSSDGIWDYFQGVKDLYLMPGNAVLEVLNDWTMNVYKPFVDAPSTSGGIEKLGSGFLRLYGENDFTGPMIVDGGGLFLQGDLPLPDTYTGAVSVANGAIIALQRDGGAGQLADLMDPLSVGRIGLYAVNAQDTIDLSSLPWVTLEVLEAFTFEGVLYPYDNLFEVELPNDFTFAGTLVDLPGNPGRILVPAGTSPDRMLTLASSNDISGLVLVEGGILRVQDENALGTGPITLRNGAALCLDTAAITDTVAAGIIARITTDSYGCILLAQPCAGLNIDLSLSGLTGVYLGARPNTLTYTGTLTPDGTTYRFGGGRQTEFSGDRGLEVNWLTGARSVEVGLPGMVFLQGNNSYSGKTRITNGGIVYLFEDSGLGTPPSSLVADHLTLDGGILRVGGDANIHVNENRGLTIGPNGGTFHNWGGTSINFWSPVTGSGTLSMTDNGALRFFSTANTFDGAVFFDMERNGTGNLDIGNGPNYSWVSPQPISGIGNGGWVAANSDSAAVFTSPLHGAVGFIKRGEGVMTMPVGGNTYSFGTRIENGSLKLAAEDAIAHGEGKGTLYLFRPAGLDVNGYNVTLNGLTGPGTLTNAAGTASVLGVGDGDAFSIFTGTLAEQMTYRKIGDGLHADFGKSLMVSPLVEGGTLMFADMRRLQGTPVLTSGGALSLKTFNGLSAVFVDQMFTPVEWAANRSVHLETLDALNDLADNASGALHTDSFSIGPYFDYGNIGQHFPGKYADPAADHFVARWQGKFYAPVPGDYRFATVSDDGSVIYINGNKVIDNNDGPNMRHGSIWLPKGHHDITIGFVEQGGLQSITVWGGLGNNLPFEVIDHLPQMFLESDAPLTPDGILANTLATPITGDAGTWIEKVGLPTLIVAVDNSAFSGKWTVRSGEACVVDGGAFGGAGAVVDAGGTLAFDYTGDATYGGDVSGNGTLRHAGAGTLTLTGKNTYTGGTVIDQGTLRVEAPGTLGGGTLVVNGTLELAFSGTVRQSDVMPVTTATGSGEIILLSGTLIADTMTSTVPVRVMPGAQYIAATPQPSVITLEGGEGAFGNSAARIIGFDDPSLWQANGSAGWVSDGVARVTDAPNPLGGGTLILKEQMNVVLPWEMSFTYTMANTTTGDPADGFSWFIHNRTDGPSARGGGATDSGVGGIRSAFGFIFQIYPHHNDPVFFRFCWVEDGYLLEDTKVEDLNGVEPRWGDTQVHIAHDGAGLVTVTLTQGSNVYTTSRQIDFAAAFNGPMGWLGFGGATGGCDADQQISDVLIYTPVSDATPLTGDNWVLNGSARFITPEVVQLTPQSGGTGNMNMKEKVDLSKMWSVSFLYYIENRQGDSADGFSLFVHNDPRGTATTGGGGGGRGHTGISPQIGFTANIYGNNYFAWITNGNEDGGRADNPNNIAPVNGNLRVTMEYDGVDLLSLRLTQGNNVWTTTRTVDLAAALGAPDAWFGISAATGGVTADQRITDVVFTYWHTEYTTPSYGASVNVVAGSTDSTLYGGCLPPDISADTLTLNHGAVLGIYANEALPTGTAYSLTFRNVVLHGASSVTVNDNGNGAGLLTFSDLYVKAGSTATFKGNIAFPGNTLTVHAPVDMPRGLHMIADFTQAIGVDSNTDFVLDPLDSPPRAKLVFRNGKLYLSLIQGTVLILR